MSEHSPWPYRDETGLPAWDERIRALLPPSVDLTQLAEDLRLTPTQRLEKLQALLEQAEQLRPRGAAARCVCQASAFLIFGTASLP